MLKGKHREQDGHSLIEWETYKLTKERTDRQRDGQTAQYADRQRLTKGEGEGGLTMTDKKKTKTHRHKNLAAEKREPEKVI